MGWIEMRAFLIFIVIESGNAELYRITTAGLPTTDDIRIINGSATTIEKYPFAVQVIYYGRFQCGGSLVTARHVLSAAHCFIAKDRVVDPSSIFIRAGATFLNQGGSLHLVTAIKVHELYDLKNMSIKNNDVAVVLLTTPVDLTTSVARPALLPYQDAVVTENSLVTAIGWGRTVEANPSASSVLNEVTVQKVNWNICRARFERLQIATGKFYTITSSMICAGLLDIGGKDACKGDSGGPLLYNEIVVGVTSWGYHCANPQYPGVYARVSNYTNWINDTINDSQLEIEEHNTGSPSSKFGATALLTSFLYLILSD